MIPAAEQRLEILQEDTVKMLHSLHISVHRQGYKALLLAIPCYALDCDQSLSKEVYPYVAQRLSYADWHGVERAIRLVILDAWERRNPAIWEDCFPGQRKAPTNKQFIAVLAQRLR